MTLTLGLKKLSFDPWSVWIAAALVYSLAHFLAASGLIGAPAAERCGGDFTAAFPAPYVRTYNPELADDFPVGKDLTWNYGPVFHAVTLPLTVLPDREAVCTAVLAGNAALLAISASYLFLSLFGPPRRDLLPCSASTRSCG